jgi:hypothetical protein
MLIFLLKCSDDWVVLIQSQQPPSAFQPTTLACILKNKNWRAFRKVRRLSALLVVNVVDNKQWWTLSSASEACSFELLVLTWEEEEQTTKRLDYCRFLHLTANKKVYNNEQRFKIISKTCTTK